MSSLDEIFSQMNWPFIIDKNIISGSGYLVSRWACPISFDYHTTRVWLLCPYNKPSPGSL